MATMKLQAAYDQAQRFLEQNDTERAIGLIQHILQHFPHSIEAHRLLGEAYLISSQFDQAEEAFCRVLSADPENIPAHVGLGITYERQGRLDRAVIEFEQSLEIKPDMTELRTQLLRLYTDAWGSEHAQLRLSRPGLARLYAKGHMLPQAIQEFRSVVADHPDRLDARVGLVEALWRHGQEDMTVTVCEEILTERQDVLKANLLLGYIKLARGSNEGERFWQAAQQLDPYQHVAQVMFGQLPSDAPSFDVTLPTWDEAAWREQREREKYQQSSSKEEIAVSTPATTPSKSAAVSEKQSHSSHAETPPSAQQKHNAKPKAKTNELSDNELLANLLGFQIFDGFEQQQRATQPTFTSQEDGKAHTETAPSDDDMFDFLEPEPSIPTPQPATESKQAHTKEPKTEEPEIEDFGLTPLSFEELGLSEDEVASLTDEPQQAQPATESSAQSNADTDADTTWSDDLGMEVEPFDWESRAGKGETQPTQQPPTEDMPAPFDVDSFADMPDMEPFSMPTGDEGAPDLDATPFDADSFADMPDMEPFSMPSGAEEPEPDVPPFDADSFADMPDLEPFDMSSVSMEDNMPFGKDETLEDMPDVQPFDMSSASAQSGMSFGEETFDDTPEVNPFGWSDDIPMPSSISDADNSSNDDFLDASLQPFSIDDLDLGTDESDMDAPSLPPSLQPFSLDDSGATPPRPPIREQPSHPSSEEEMGQEEGTYSWQLPSSKSGTDILRGQKPKGSEQQQQLESEEQNQFSIFAKLKQRREEIPPEEPPPLPEVVLDEEDEIFFSDDDVSLRDDEDDNVTISGISSRASDAASPFIAMDDAPTSEEPEVSPLSLEELGLSPEEIAALNQEESEPIPEAPTTNIIDEEPEISPLSLEQLGLSPEEIAALNQEESEPIPEAPTTNIIDEEPEVSPLSLEELGLSPEEIAALNQQQEVPIVADNREQEPEISPLSLEELGLSPEEIAALNQEESEPIPEAPAPTQPEPTTEVEEPELTPFSLDDLGLSADEIASLNEQVQETPETFASEVTEEPEVAPLSLEELGLSPEEIAALNEGSSEETPISIETISPASEPVPEEQPQQETGFSLDDISFEEDTAPAPAPERIDPDTAPFSIEDLGLSDEETDSFGESDDFQPALPTTPPKSKAPETQLLDDVDIQPFSLEDLELGDSSFFDDRNADKLGLTTEELSSIDTLGGLVKQPASGSQDKIQMPDTGDLALDQLIYLGQRQGFVDLTDIINVVEDPVAESDRIEDIGRALYRAGIEIRDGDEIINMEEEMGYEEDYYDDEDVETSPEPEPLQEEAEPDISPLSLEDLGVSESELEGFHFPEAEISSSNTESSDGFDFDFGEEMTFPEAPDTAQPATEPDPEPIPEPEIAPLSFAELGLSEEEIAMLGIETDGEETAVTEPEPEPVATAPEPEPVAMPEAEPEIAPLSFAELGLSEEEIAMLGLESGGEGAEGEPAPEPVVDLEPEPEPVAPEPEPEPVAITPEPEPIAMPEAEPEIAPLSLAELGLSEEEIAMLGLESGGEEAEDEPEPEPFIDLEPEPEPTAITREPEPEPTIASDEAEPEVSPLSLAELGLSEEEIAMLGLEGSDEPEPEPESPIALEPEPELELAITPDETEPEIAPLSFAELGLSEEEIAMLGLEGSDEPEPEPESPIALEPEPELELAITPDETEPEIAPLSFAELRLSEEEIAMLGLEGSDEPEPEPESPIALEPEPELELAITPDETEPEIAPLSFAELGLSEEEIAMLGLEGSDEPEPEPEPESPIALEPEPEPEPAIKPDEAEPEIAPLSFAELGLSEEEIAMLGLEVEEGSEDEAAASTSEPEQTAPHIQPEPDVAATSEAVAPSEEAEPEVSPLSLAELGLSEEEIAMLGLGEEAEETEEATTPFATPEPEPEPQQAITPKPEPEPEVETPSSGDETEIAPLSLAELGLSEEEITMLGLGEDAEETATPATAPEPTPEPEPEPLDFDFASETETTEAKPAKTSDPEGFGLTDEELALLGGLAATTGSSGSSEHPSFPIGEGEPVTGDTLSVSPEELDLLDLNLGGEHEAHMKPVKHVKPREEREEEAPPPPSPEDLAFVPEPLDALDDIWDQPDIESAETPARAIIERPAQPPEQEDTFDIEPHPKRPSPSSSRASARSSSERTGRGRPTTTRRGSRTRSTESTTHSARHGSAPTNTGSRAERYAAHKSTIQKDDQSASFIPTGDEELDNYIRQFETEPENYALCLTIARTGMQTNRHDLAIHHYKHLVKEGMLLQEIVEDIEDWIKETEDQALLKQLHRLLGDTYIKQKRFSQAMAAYNWKPGS